MIRSMKSGNGSEFAGHAADAASSQELKAKVHSRLLATMESAARCRTTRESVRDNRDGQHRNY